MKTKSVSKINTNEERDETQEQLKLWRDAERNKKWDDAPAKVKVIKTRLANKIPVYTFN